MEFILTQLENPNFIINLATFIAFLMLAMVGLTIYDYIKTMRPFWEIEKKYKQQLLLLDSRKKHKGY